LPHNLNIKGPIPTSRGSIMNRSAVVILGGRLVGAALLAGMAGIHLHLYTAGYRTVHTIGPLFVLNAALGALATLAVLATPRRWLGWASLAGALLQAGTLGALLLSLTVGLLGFHESTKAPLIPTTIVVELAGAVVLLALAVRAAATVADAGGTPPCPHRPGYLQGHRHRLKRAAGASSSRSPSAHP